MHKLKADATILSGVEDLTKSTKFIADLLQIRQAWLPLFWALIPSFKWGRVNTGEVHRIAFPHSVVECRFYSARSVQSHGLTHSRRAHTQTPETGHAATSGARNLRMCINNAVPRHSSQKKFLLARGIQTEPNWLVLVPYLDIAKRGAPRCACC